jgi:hypothetical protein
VFNRFRIYRETLSRFSCAASSGTGYTAGGQNLSNVTIQSTSNGIVYVSFDNVVWNPAQFDGAWRVDLQLDKK